MNWIVLFIAGVFEVAMTFCLGKTKGAQGTELYLWIGGFVLATVLSMGLLAKAVQTLPIGTAYAIWTGVGALGTVLLGIFVFALYFRYSIIVAGKRNTHSETRSLFFNTTNRN